MPIDPRRIEVLDEQMAAIFREMTPARKLEIANGMWRSARSMIQSMLQHDHPEWTAEQVSREVARRMSRGAW